MKKLMRLVEAGERTAFVNAKAVEYKDEKELQDLKDNPDVKSISTAQGKKIKEEVNPYEYTKTDSAALGQDVLKVLVDTLKAQGDEIHKTPEGRPDVKLTAGTNRFSIEVNYGDNVNAKNDIFKFTIDPQTSKLMYKLGTNDIPLIKILKTTEGNADSVNKTLLQKNLGVVLKKLKTAPKVNDTQPEPSPEEYDQMAAMEPEHDPSQMNKYISEEMLEEKTFTINGLGTFELTGMKDEFVMGSQNNGPIRTFKKERVLQDNPNFFDRKPRESKPQGVRPYSEAQYRKILQGAIDDAGSTEFAYDIADSMIHDPQILARLKKDYPGEPVKELKQQLQYDLEACDAPDDDYEDNEVAEKQLTKPELKKREEIVKSMKKQGEPKDARTYAIATAQAKKLAEDLDLGHEDDEPGMLLSDIYGIMQSAKSLYELVSQFKGQQEVDFPHWWQAKIVNAKANLSAARQYLDYEVNKPEQQQVNIAAVALEEVKGTCCHKCGHVHVKGTAHPTPYLTGQKNCKFRD